MLFFRGFYDFLISFLNEKMKRKLYSLGAHGPSKAYEYSLLHDAFKVDCEASNEMNEIHQDYAFVNIHSSLFMSVGIPDDELKCFTKTL